MDPIRPVRVFLLCSGLGNVHRGYESFAEECFEELRNEPGLDLRLYKGGGQSAERQTRLWNFTRDSGTARFLGRTARLLGASVGDTRYVEGRSFVLALLPHLSRWRPEVIYHMEPWVGVPLWHLRKIFGLRYRLLFRNGGPAYPPYPRADHVQHLTQPFLDLVLRQGESPDKHTLVPNAFQVAPELRLLPLLEREALRRRLGLPESRPIVVSVAAIEVHHKRMGYVVQEVARLPPPRPFLLMLGEEEDPLPRRLARELLGEDGFAIRTVDHAGVADYLRCSDAHVLASLLEGFGRAHVEALAQGLVCLAHDYDVARYVLGDAGLLANLSVEGNLARLISEALEGDHSDRRRLGHRLVYQSFSWDRLRSAYVDLIRRVARVEPQARVRPDNQASEEK